MIDMNHGGVTDATDDFMDALTFTDEPATLPPMPEGDVMVVRSLRLPVALETRARALAKTRNVPYTTLIREWIIDGLERDEVSDQRDPVTELRRIATAASRALQVLEPKRNAA